MFLPATSRAGPGPSAATLAVGLLVLVGATAVSAAGGVVEPRATTTDAARLQPWVTVNRFSVATTITPSVTVDGKGATSTISAFPGDVTSAPTAAADGSLQFLKCQNIDGDFAPFCTPDLTSHLETGNTYIITWNPDFFVDQNQGVEIQGDISSPDKDSLGGRDGVLIDNPTTIATGFIRWSLTDEWLVDDASPANVTIFMLFANSDGSLTRNLGPNLQVFPGTAASSASGSGINMRALKIALPAVLGTVVLALVGLGLWWFCRRRRSDGGYGVRKSRIQRVSGSATKDGIRMDYYSAPGARTGFMGGGVGGGNMFREEVRRQDRDRFGRR